jgi:HlyD family secretion protein
MIRDTAAQDIALDRSPAVLRWKWVLAAALAAAVISGLWWILGGTASRSVSAQSLRMATVSRGAFVSDVTAQGRVVAAISPTLYAPALGTVTLKVKAGDSVLRGAVLATLDSPDITNEAAREQANLRGLEATLQRERLEVEARKLELQQSVDLAGVAVDAAQRELKRAQDANRQGVLPIMEVDRRGDGLTEALVRYQHARKDAELQSRGLDYQLRSRALEIDRQGLLVENLQRRVDALNIVSPVDGVVGSVSVSDRAAVAVNAPLMTVVDLSALEVEIQVPETYADALGIDMPAEVRMGNQIFAAKLTAIAPEVNNNQVVGRVAFTGAAPSELRQNQRVSARIVLDQRDNVLQVPRGSFLESGGGRFAYVVRDGVAIRTAIRTGAISIDRVELLEGVQPGDTLVVSGDQNFESAPTVRVRN